MSRTMQRPSVRTETRSGSQTVDHASAASVVSLSAPKRRRPSWMLAGVSAGRSVSAARCVGVQRHVGDHERDGGGP